jgi:hypothetical protein
MFHSQTMSPYFVLPAKHAKYEFKTKIMRDGIELARPVDKIPKLSRDSRFKVARSKARSATRGRREQYEDEYTNRGYDVHLEESIDIDTFNTFRDYLDYCYEELHYEEDVKLSYAQYCAIHVEYFTTTTTPKTKLYAPPQVRPDDDVIINHWPKRVMSNKSYAQMAR